MVLQVGAAWKDARVIQRLVKVVTEESFVLERCTEVQNQERSVGTHQEQAGESVFLGHQLGQVPW